MGWDWTHAQVVLKDPLQRHLPRERSKTANAVRATEDLTPDQYVSRAKVESTSVQGGPDTAQAVLGAPTVLLLFQLVAVCVHQARFRAQPGIQRAKHVLQGPMSTTKELCSAHSAHQERMLVRQSIKDSRPSIASSAGPASIRLK